MDQPLKASLHKNRHARNAPWWLRYLQENPLKFGSSAILAVGGLLVLIFFVRLRFMPEVDLGSSTAVLAAVALIGLFFVLYTALTAVMPGIATRQWASDFGLRENRWAAAAIAVPPVLLILLVLLQAYGWLRLLGEPSVWIMLLDVFLISLLLSAAALRPRNLQAAGGGRPTWQLLTELWLTSLLWVIGIFFIYYLFIVLSDDSGQGEWELLIFSLVWLTFATLSNLAIAATNAPWRIIAAVGGVAFFLVLLLSSSFSKVPVMAIRALGLGEIGEVRLALTERGCHAFNRAAGGTIRCAIESGATSGYVCPAILKSRIGAQMLLEIADTNKGEDSNAVMQRVVMDKADVLAWSVPPDGLPNRKGAANASRNETSDQKKQRLEEERKMHMKEFCAPSLIVATVLKPPRN